MTLERQNKWGVEELANIVIPTVLDWLGKKTTGQRTRHAMGGCVFMSYFVSLTMEIHTTKERSSGRKRKDRSMIHRQSLPQPPEPRTRCGWSEYKNT